MRVAAAQAALASAESGEDSALRALQDASALADERWSALHKISERKKNATKLMIERVEAHRLLELAKLALRDAAAEGPLATFRREWREMRQQQRKGTDMKLLSQSQRQAALLEAIYELEERAWSAAQAVERARREEFRALAGARAAASAERARARAAAAAASAAAAAAAASSSSAVSSRPPPPPPPPSAARYSSFRAEAVARAAREASARGSARLERISEESGEELREWARWSACGAGGGASSSSSSFSRFELAVAAVASEF